jgi:hypothetical protein
MKGGWAIRRFWSSLILVILCVPFLRAAGLIKEESYAGLSATKGPVYITWTLDDTTIRQLGGGDGFADDMGGVVFKRLRQGGVDMKDGTFDPNKVAFVNLDLWTRGVSKPEDPKDPQKVFHFQFQVFAPASILRIRSSQPGRVLVWERSVYGVAPMADIQQQFRDFLRLSNEFAVDWEETHVGDALDEKAGKPATVPPHSAQGLSGSAKP